MSFIFSLMLVDTGVLVHMEVLLVKQVTFREHRFKLPLSGWNRLCFSWTQLFLAWTQTDGSSSNTSRSPSAVRDWRA